MKHALRKLRFLLLLLVVPAFADTIHLKNGSKLEGKILSEDTARVKIKMASGEATVERADIDHIDYGPSPAEELEKRRAALDAKKTDDVIALAKWALSKGFRKEALEIARSGDAKALVLEMIDADIRRRTEEINGLTRLGLVSRACELIATAESELPEAKDRLHALTPKPPPKKKHGAKIEAEVNAWFAAGTDVKTECPLADLLAAIRLGPRGSAATAGLVERKTPSGATYLLRIPKDYDPEFASPLLISLHGTGGTDRGALAAWEKSLEGETELLVAFPNGGLPGWGNSKAGHERVLGVLRDVAANFSVDLDRVCLDGASMGGHGAFFLAMYYPDRWASIAPRVASARLINLTAAGGMPDVSPAPSQLDNLWDIPTFLISGVKDTHSPIDEVRTTKQRLDRIGTPLVYRESPEGGHEWYGGEDRDVLDFLKYHVRDPYPKKVKLVSRELAFSRSYWIEVLESTRNPRIEITHIDMDRKPIEMRKELDKALEVTAEADKAKNKITIQASGVKEMRIWLSDELLDLDRSITVVANNATVFEGKVERSRTVALEECKRRDDRSMPFVAQVKVRLK